MQSRLRLFLVGGEFALAGVLLICAMLLVKSFHQMEAADRGYRAEGVMTLQIALSGADYDDSHRRSLFAQRVLQETRALQGVTAADLVDFLPSSNYGFQAAAVSAEDRPVEHGDEAVATRNAISEDHFATFKIPLFAGRGFTLDEVAQGKPVAIVSAALGKQLWAEGNPLGRRLRLAGGLDPEPLTVVGVAGDIRQASLVGSSGQWPQKQLEQVQNEFEWLPRFWSEMFSIFALLGVFIAAMGLYGIVSHSMAQRNREFGIRTALGARSQDLLRLPFQQGLRLALVGLALGIVGALGVARLMKSLLYSVQPADPWVYGGVSALIVVIALAASLIPAYRVLKLDPIQALRAE
jgi:putative ABC transport system permease protein